jgi:hypothetical protein
MMELLNLEPKERLTDMYTKATKDLCKKKLWFVKFGCVVLYMRKIIIEERR